MLRRLASVVLAIALVASGCSRDGGGDRDRGAGGPPKKGGTLRVALAGLGSLDPAQARSPEQVLAAEQLFDSLTAYDPDTLAPVPSLAARWESTPDQKVWTFTLRPGISFANGRAITGDDVRYTLDRVVKPDTASPFADLLELVSGHRAVTDGSTASLSGVAVPAPDTVVITLDQPWSALPSVLAIPGLGIVPREAVEAAEPAFSAEPVGSGPFRFVSRTDDKVVLARAAGGNAHVDKVELIRFDDTDAAYAAFRDGDVDWSRVPPGDAESAARTYGRSGFVPYLASLFYLFNLNSPKVADVRFREAIVHAIDRRALVRAVYGETVIPSDGIVVDGIQGSVEDACGARCRHDPGRARELIAAAFPGGAVPEIGIDFDDDPTQAAVAGSIEANLEAVGIPAAVRPKALNEYQDFVVSGQQELFRLGWLAPYPSPDAYLPLLFATKFPSNLTGFSDPAVDALLQAARAEPDATKRMEAYRAAEQAILAAVPVVPIGQFRILTVAGKNVRGVKVTTAGTFDASAAWLDR